MATFLPNCAELVFAYLALWRLGAVAVPLNYRYRAAEIEYAMSDCEAAWLIHHAEKASDVAAAPLERLGVRRHWLVGGEANCDGEQQARSSQTSRGPLADLANDRSAAPFAELLPTQPPQASRKVPGETDKNVRPTSTETRSADDAQPAFDWPASILYTSGSTNKPKGVTHTQGTLAHSNRIQSATQQLDASDVQLISLSISHAAGSLHQMLPTFFVSATVVLLNAPTPQQVVDAVHRNRATRLVMLPTVLADLVEHLEQHPADLSSVRTLSAGGDVVPHELHERFHKVAGFCVTEVYGMTEGVTFVSNPPLGEKRIGSVGLPASETELRIVDDHGQRLPPGQVGEIIVRNASVMIGYWNNPQATAAALVDGWLRTGDVGRLDEDGYLWFVGRRKEIIIHGGSNIAPGEVEEVIDQHPSVHVSGVVGMRDARWGQAPVAYVALRHDAPPIGEAELRQFVAERIAAYKVPDEFIFTRDMPLNSTGKVDRKKLHELVAAREREQVS